MECKKNCETCLACAHGKDEIKQRFTTYHFYGLSVSTGNNKIGLTVNYSLDNRHCSPAWACYKYCYAKRYCEFRPSCQAAYGNNADLLENNSAAFWVGVEKAFQLAGLLNAGLRVHVDGEIPAGAAGVEYFNKLQQLARKYSGVAVILMTKQYSVINTWLDTHGGREALALNCIPAFSACPGLDMPNPYNLPVRGFIGKKTGYTRKREIMPQSDRKKGGACVDLCRLYKKGIKCAGADSLYFTEH